VTHKEMQVEATLILTMFCGLLKVALNIPDDSLIKSLGVPVEKFRAITFGGDAARALAAAIGVVTIPGVQAGPNEQGITENVTPTEA
jgi:hypothetical protein